MGFLFYVPMCFQCFPVLFYVSAICFAVFCKFPLLLMFANFRNSSLSTNVFSCVFFEINHALYCFNLFWKLPGACISNIIVTTAGTTCTGDKLTEDSVPGTWTVERVCESVTILPFCMALSTSILRSWRSLRVTWWHVQLFTVPPSGDKMKFRCLLQLIHTADLCTCIIYWSPKKKPWRPCQNVEMGFQTPSRCSWARYCISMFTQTTCKSNRWTNGCQNLFWIRMFGSYNSGAGRRDGFLGNWYGFLHVSTGLWVVSDVGFKRKKISRVRNRFGTSGNAIGIFSICGRVAALGYVISESCAAVCGSF